MFVCMNIVPSGYIMSRADRLGFTDAEILEVQAERASPERVEAVNGALRMAMHALQAATIGGRPC